MHFIKFIGPSQLHLWSWFRCGPGSHICVSMYTSLMQETVDMLISILTDVQLYACSITSLHYGHEWNSEHLLDGVYIYIYIVKAYVTLRYVSNKPASVLFAAIMWRCEMLFSLHTFISEIIVRMRIKALAKWRHGAVSRCPRWVGGGGGGCPVWASGRALTLRCRHWLAETDRWCFCILRHTRDSRGACRYIL